MTEEELRRLQKERGFRIVDTNKPKPRPELSEFSLDVPKKHTIPGSAETDKKILKELNEKMKQVYEVYKRGRPNMSDPENVANPRKKNKFNAKKVTIDGITFDSTKEGRRYEELKLLEKAGEISDLMLQCQYEFVHEGQLIGRYRADFAYMTTDGLVVEDVKSPATRKKADYRLRKRMMAVFFGIEILET